VCFLRQRIAVEENQEDGLDKDGEAMEVSSMLFKSTLKQA